MEIDGIHNGLNRLWRVKPAGATASAVKSPQNTSTATGVSPETGDEPHIGPHELTPGEKEQVAKLQARDQEVRAHEAAHMDAAGSAAVGEPTFIYQMGPDGKMYAIGGSVAIQIAPGGTPEETLAKAKQLNEAATAPTQPSAQDMAVAAQTAEIAQQARQQIAGESKSSQQSSQVSALYERARSSSQPQQINAMA